MTKDQSDMRVVGCQDCGGDGIEKIPCDEDDVVCEFCRGHGQNWVDGAGRFIAPYVDPTVAPTVKGAGHPYTKHAAGDADGRREITFKDDMPYVCLLIE